MMVRFILAIVCNLLAIQLNGQLQPAGTDDYIDLSKFRDGIHHWELYSPIRSSERLDTADITGIADNLLAFQNPDGGWPKNIDWLTTIDPDSIRGALNDRYRSSTFDNSNTFPQIEYLAEVYNRTGAKKYRIGALKGFQFILDTENPRGGWRGWDADAITFNDEVMTGIMHLLLDVKEMDGRYDWLGNSMRKQLNQAFLRGLEVMLSCQIEIDGVKTGWCQQHDFESHAPEQGRTYEHPSVTSRESSSVLLFLMRIQNPEPAIVEAVESGVAWLENAKIEGFRYAKVPIQARPYHESTVDFDRVFEPDPSAPPVWARYYDLENGKPFLSLRDGTIVYNLSEVSFDRRIGYAWYGFWPEAVLEKYPGWKSSLKTE